MQQLKIKIEKGVRLSQPFDKNTVSSKVFNAMKKMQVQDSFVIQNAHYITYSFLKHMDDFKNKIFTSRTEDNQHKRIWRIK